jgi:natural product biosynthesis luciferase-like monooxygenase protein
MIPQMMVRLDEMPLTANGKIDRKLLPAPDASQRFGKNDYIAPRNEIETEVARIWEQLLGVERVGADDNFFDLGGHSLLATQIMSRVRESFDIELSLRKMFERPTLAGLAEAVAEAKQNHSEQGAKAIVATARAGRRMKRTSTGKLTSSAIEGQQSAQPADTLRSVAAQEQPQSFQRKSDAPLEFSLFFFSDDGSTVSEDKYGLLTRSVKYADENGFRAVWTPERHFHDFGGLYPNPSVISAALAAITERIELRAGSVVLPLQDPLRVAEEWSVIDNLTAGRVAVAFASGWHADDFVLNPQAYETKREVMYEGIETIQRLWRGDSVKRINGAGNEVEVRIYPRPIQNNLPIWITCQSDESFVKAGEMGANVLTNFNYKREEDLVERVEKYRAARRRSQFGGEGIVTLMMHTFVWNDPVEMFDKVKNAYGEYLHTNMGLQAKLAAGLNIEAKVSDEDKQVLIENAVNRLIGSHGIVGTVETCIERARRLSAMGVNEIACLIDFGIDRDTVLESLFYLNEVKRTLQAETAIESLELAEALS